MSPPSRFPSQRSHFFGGNASYGGKIFTLQKKIIRIMADAQPRTSCRSLFKQLEIPPIPCQYILPLKNFIINNKDIFQTNSSIHNINTRLNANLSCFQTSIFYAGIKIFSSLPPTLTVLKNDTEIFQGD